MIHTWKVGEAADTMSMLHNIYGLTIRCMDLSPDILTCGVEGYDPSLVNKEHKVRQFIFVIDPLDYSAEGVLLLSVYVSDKSLFTLWV